MAEVILRDSAPAHVVLRNPKYTLVPLHSADQASTRRAVIEARNEANRANEAADRAEIAQDGSEAAQQGVIDELNGVTITSATVAVASRTLLSALAHTLPAYLAEVGREGTFVWRAGNYTARVAADPTQGMYVADQADTTGATGAWVRQRGSLEVHATWYGASPNATAATNTEAFRASSAMIVYQGGGRHITAPGEYSVGKQTFAGSGGLGYSYNGLNGFIEIVGCTGGVEIIGYGVKLKNVDGYKYGAFNPTTGVAHNGGGTFADINYRAWLVSGQIYLELNTGPITVRGFELDGNVENMDLGGLWAADNSGRQIAGCGILAYNNHSLRVEHCHSHHHPLDGMQLGWAGLTTSHPIYPVTLDNCRFLYNGRQALSWVGGNKLTATGCSFSKTGKNGILESGPAAGLDIEAEGSINRNGVFINCEMIDNGGAAMISDAGGDNEDMFFYGCTFIATTYFSVFPNNPRFRFHDCLIVGQMAGFHGDPNPDEANQFHNCRFSSDPALSPTGTVYGAVLMDMAGDDENVLFNNCLLDATDDFVTVIGTTGAARIHDCKVTQEAVGTSYWRGTFTGNNLVLTAGTNDFGTSANYGRLAHNADELGKSVPGDLDVGGDLILDATKMLRLQGDTQKRVELYWDAGFGGGHLESYSTVEGFKPMRIRGSSVELCWAVTPLLRANGLGLDFLTTNVMVNGTRVITAQQGAIANPPDPATDAELRLAVIQILGALRTHGLIAT